MSGSLPPWYRRLACRVLGHVWCDGGLSGVLSFAYCRRCGKWEYWSTP